MSRIAELENSLCSLEKELERYKEKFRQSVEAYDILLQAFKQLQRREFGQKSERFIDKNPGQADMFSDREPVLIAEDENTDDDIESKPAPRKNKKKDLSMIKIMLKDCRDAR